MSLFSFINKMLKNYKKKSINYFMISALTIFLAISKLFGAVNPRVSRSSQNVVLANNPNAFPDALVEIDVTDIVVVTTTNTNFLTNTIFTIGNTTSVLYVETVSYTVFIPSTSTSTSSTDTTSTATWTETYTVTVDVDLIVDYTETIDLFLTYTNYSTETVYIMTDSPNNN